MFGVAGWVRDVCERNFKNFSIERILKDFFFIARFVFH